MTAFDNVLDQCLAVGAGEEIVLLADEGTDLTSCPACPTGHRT